MHVCMQIVQVVFDDACILTCMYMCVIYIYIYIYMLYVSHVCFVYRVRCFCLPYYMFDMHRPPPLVTIFPAFNCAFAFSLSRLVCAFTSFLQ